MAVFAASPAIKTAARTQILSAPGVGLFLAAVILMLSRLVRGRGDLVAGLLAAWVVGLGTARVAAMQADWDQRSYWPAQRASLAGLVREAPNLLPRTFVIVLGGKDAWPASFTLHHALAYLYERRATGTAWGAEPFLYPTSLGSAGFVVAPLESIRVPWAEPVRLYSHDQLVIARMASDAVTILDTWPVVELGPLPAGARYVPRERIQSGPSGPRVGILDDP
jgi:hypothetical protein